MVCPRNAQCRVAGMEWKISSIRRHQRFAGEEWLILPTPNVRTKAHVHVLQAMQRLIGHTSSHRRHCIMGLRLGSGVSRARAAVQSDSCKCGRRPRAWWARRLARYPKCTNPAAVSTIHASRDAIVAPGRTPDVALRESMREKPPEQLPTQCLAQSRTRRERQLGWPRYVTLFLPPRPPFFRQHALTRCKSD